MRAHTLIAAAGCGLALAACGGGASAPQVDPSVAQQRVERAAKVELVSEAVPAEARDQGMIASFSNTATAVADEQAVALFVMKDAGVVDEVSEQIRSSAPASAQLIVHGPVMVVYAAAGADRATAVQSAVDGL